MGKDLLVGAFDELVTPNGVVNCDIGDVIVF